MSGGSRVLVRPGLLAGLFFGIVFGLVLCGPTPTSASRARTLDREEMTRRANHTLQERCIDLPVRWDAVPHEAVMALAKTPDDRVPDSPCAGALLARGEEAAGRG